MMATKPESLLVSIPLSPEELKVLNAYRSLAPKESMKVSKNQDGSMITITVERHESVRVEYSQPPAYGTIKA